MNNCGENLFVLTLITFVVLGIFKFFDIIIWCIEHIRIVE